MRHTIVWRTIAALAGGYLLSALGGINLGLWLPLSRADRAMAGTLAGLLIWPATLMAAFGIPHTRSMLTTLLGAILILTLIAIAGGWRP